MHSDILLLYFIMFSNADSNVLKMISEPTNRLEHLLEFWRNCAFMDVKVQVSWKSDPKIKL